MKLGEKIKKLREQKKISQDKLGEIIGVYGRYLSKVENSRAIPGLEVIKKLAVALEVSTDYLIFDSVPLAATTIKVFDPELFDLFYELEILPKEKTDYLKSLIKDLILANKAATFVQDSKRNYSKKKK